MGDYNNDCVRANNEDDKKWKRQKYVRRVSPFWGRVLMALIVCAAEDATSEVVYDDVEPVGEPTAFLKVGTLWLLLSRSRLASVPFRS